MSDHDTTPSANDLVFESPPGADELARAQSFAKERTDLGTPTKVVVKEQAARVDTSPERPLANFDAPASAEEEPVEGKAKDEESGANGGVGPEDGQDSVKKPEGQQGGDAEPAKKGVELTLGGEKKTFTYHELRTRLGREAAMQRKVQELTGSEELRLGTLMKAAERGDKGAAKKVQAMLMKSLQAETGDDLTDKLEGVKDEFDEEAELKKTAGDPEFDSAFADVKDSVDFKETLAKIDTDLKARIPEKVFKAYRSSPQHLRVMYDLVATGRDATVLDALNQKIATLPFEKQLDVKSDPELYGTAFLTVVEQLNAENAASAGTGSPALKDEVDSVSAGGRGRNPSTQAPDFLGQSLSDFNAVRKKLGLEPVGG